MGRGRGRGRRGREGEEGGRGRRGRRKTRNKANGCEQRVITFPSSSTGPSIAPLFSNKTTRLRDKQACDNDMELLGT